MSKICAHVFICECINGKGEAERAKQPKINIQQKI